MKRILAMFLAMLLSFSLLTGCGGGTDTPSTPDADGATTGSRPSIVRFSADSTPKIDPAVITDLVGSICVENLYDGLVLQDGSEQVPNLATEWETSEDGLEYTFHLKQGVKFHSGNEMKASDVVFSFNRFKTIGEGFAYLFANVKECVAVDEYTVKFVLSQSMGSFMGIIWHLYVLDEATVMANIVADGTYGDEYGDYGKAWLLENDAGSGPYTATEMVHSEYFLASRFADWHMGWEGRENAPEQFKAIYMTEPSTQQTMMANQQLEISSPWFAPENYEALDAIDGIDLAFTSWACTQYVFFNTTVAPTDDVNYRKALSCLLDYESFIGPCFYGASLSVGPVSSSIAGHNDNCTTYKYDLEKAKEYLAQSKYADTYQTIELDCFLLDAAPALEKMMLSLQASCAQVGITMNIRKGPWLTYQEQIASAETTPNVSTCNITPSVNDAASVMRTLFGSATQGTFENPTWVANAELDAKLDAAVAMTDTAERNAVAEELQDYVMSELCPSAPVGDLAAPYAYQSSYIDWPVANYYNETGELKYYALGMDMYMPDISVYTDR